MIKIRIFTDFHRENEFTDNIYNLYTKYDDEHNNKYCFTNDDDYTHVILINCPMPNISHIPKENVIGLAFEPYHFLQNIKLYHHYAQKFISKYYIGDKYDLQEPFVEGYGYIPPWFDFHIEKKTKVLG